MGFATITLRVLVNGEEMELRHRTYTVRDGEELILDFPVKFRLDLPARRGTSVETITTTTTREVRHG